MKLYRYFKMPILIFSCLFCISVATVTLATETLVNEPSFTDIETHWAKSDIVTLVQNNILNGYSDNTFRPNDKITVAEFLKIVVVGGNYELLRVGETPWPDFYIATAKQNKLINEDEFIDYNIPITRNEAARIIARYIDLSEVKANKNIFSDLSEAYKTDILKLVNIKIINGYSDKTFRGENTITRAEAATIIKKAIVYKREKNSKNTCDVTRTDLSNYGADAKDEKSYKNTRYEIKNNELQIFDNGRYSNSDGYAIKNEIVDTTKVIKIIKNMIYEDTYTAVIYSPSKYTINQLKIAHGEDSNKIERGGEDFSFTYYEDKLYELSRISMEEKFTNDCYLKIEVKKMWKDYSEYLKGDYIDNHKKDVLLDALKIEFGSSNANKILKYMLEKNEKYVSNKERDMAHVEKKKFGSYIVNFYQKEHGVPTFYISKD